MNKNISIDCVIAGATQDSVGYDGIIASTPLYNNDGVVYATFISIDKDIFKYFSQFDFRYDDILQLSVPLMIRDKLFYVVCRAKKRFTNFIKDNRFYERFEFYYSPCGEYSPLDIINGLPDMLQYEKKNLGGLEQLQVKITDKFPAATNVTKAIFSNLLLKNPVVLKIDSNNEIKFQEELITAIYPIPLIYQKYLGLGFNLKKTPSNYLNDKLHIYTSEDNGVPLQDLKVNKQDMLFVDAVFHGMVKYTDTEIELLKLPINSETLYILLDYHKLHYQVDNDIVLENEDLQNKSESYIFNFIKKEYTKNEYIKKRITAILKFWCNHKMLNFALYEKIKKLCIEQSFDFPQDTEIKTYIEELYRNKDYSKLTLDDQYKELIENNHLSDENRKSIIERLGLVYLFNKMGFDGLLKSKIIFETILSLIKNENLETVLKWKKQYGEIDKKLEIKINPTSDLVNFQSICRYFLNYSSVKYSISIKEFIQQSIDLSGNRELDFYKSALTVASNNNFNIDLSKKDINNKGGHLFEFYKLFQKEQYIDKSNVLLDKIAKDFIVTEFSNKSVIEILDFAREERNFSESYNKEIITCIIIRYKESTNQFDILKSLLKEKENHFLYPGNELYSLIGEMRLTKQQCFELYELGKNIKSDLLVVINRLIDDNMKNQNEQEKKRIQAKMKNVIANSTKKMKNLAITFATLCFSLLILSIYLGFGDRIKSNVTSKNSTLNQPELLNLDSIIIDSLRNEIELRDSLSPYPNSKLSVDDFNELYKNGSKTERLRIDMSTDSVVDIIFKRNPKSIGNYYSGKEKYYKELLNIKNPGSFNKNMLIDSLKFIPCYKQNKDASKNEKVVKTNEAHI